MLRSVLAALIAIAGLAGQSIGIDFWSGPARAVRDITTAPTLEDVAVTAFEFQRPALYETTVRYGPIDGEPSMGVRYGVKASIDGEAALKDVGFDAIDDGGATIERITMAPAGSGVPGESEFLGLMDVPNRPFRIRLTGESFDGRSVRRVFHRRFVPRAEAAHDAPHPADVSLEDAKAFQRMFDELAPRVVAERQALVADSGAERIELPRTMVSNVRYAPLLAGGGRPVGIRVTYLVTFSRSGRYAPELSIHAVRGPGAPASATDMYVLKATIDPRPHEVGAPNREAAHAASGLFQPADFLYLRDTAYSFAVDLVPSYVRVDSRPASLCFEPRVLERSRVTAVAGAPDAPTTYRLSISGKRFEGAIADFHAPATLYQSLIAEGVQNCR
jgi:hypothetical protein